MAESCCYGVYERLPDGRWLYPWGSEVPGARDMTVRDMLEHGLLDGTGDEVPEELDLAIGQDPLADPPDDDSVESELDRVVGLTAPELHVRAMLTVADVAEMVGVARDTIAAYRYRRYLPEPQAVIGRTPVWSRPIIRHWVEHRPGNGWRTDIYGDREQYDEWIRHQRATRRRRRVQHG